MVGFVTERDLEQAEEAFPGIVRFFESLARKPRTFLELVSKYEQVRDADARRSRGSVRKSVVGASKCRFPNPKPLRRRGSIGRCLRDRS